MGRSEYAEMIGVIYATLGVLLWIAALAIRTNTKVGSHLPFGPISCTVG